jgi:CheY-like chemotaxis protein
MAKILVVDDEEDIRELFSDVLSDEHTVIGANNGKEGLLMYGKHQPDIIITDMNMPEISGYELVRSIRAIGSNSKIIAISALLQSSDECELMLRAGVDLCLPKPLSVALIKQAISGILSFQAKINI